MIELQEHWTDEINVQELHEPTVRAIIDTMKRTGAGFSAYVLECQYKHSHIQNIENETAKRIRDIADFVESNPDFPLTVNGSNRYNPLTIFANDVEDMNSKRRTIGGNWEKSVSDYYYTLTGRIGESFVKIIASRDAVCERVVTGTEVQMIPDPDSPKIEKEVDIVEWVCPDSLLG